MEVSTRIVNQYQHNTIKIQLKKTFHGRKSLSFRPIKGLVRKRKILSCSQKIRTFIYFSIIEVIFPLLFRLPNYSYTSTTTRDTSFFKAVW